MKVSADAWFWVLTGIGAAAAVALVLFYAREVYR